MGTARPKNAFEVLLQGGRKRCSEGSLHDTSQKRPKVDTKPAPTPQSESSQAAQVLDTGSSQSLPPSCVVSTASLLQQIPPSGSAQPDSRARNIPSNLPQTAQTAHGANAFSKLMSMRPAAPARIRFATQQDTSGQWTWSWTQHQKPKSSMASPSHALATSTGQPEQAAVSSTAQPSQADSPLHASAAHAVMSVSSSAHADVSLAASQQVWEAQVKLQLPEHLLTRPQASAESITNQQEVLQPCSDTNFQHHCQQEPDPPAHPHLTNVKTPHDRSGQSSQAKPSSRSTEFLQPRPQEAHPRASTCKPSAPKGLPHADSVPGSSQEADAKQTKHADQPPKLRQAIISLHADADASAVNWTNTHMQSNQRAGRTYHGTPALLKSALQKCVRRGLADQAVR